MAIKPTVPFNFDEIYASVQQKFEDKGYDSLYEGSNTAQLITAMSYITSMLNVNTAVNVNETILTLANKRNNILTDARILGYEISHINSYIYDVTLEFSEVGNHTISKYTKFTSGNYSYYYFGADINVTVVDVPVQVTIEVKEGNLKTFDAYPELLTSVAQKVLDKNGVEINQYYVDVPFQDVEDDGLEVFLTYYDEYGVLHDNESWKKSSQFLIDKDSVLDKEYVRLDDIEHKMPRLYFKFGGVGQGLRLGTNIEINALVSSGIDGAMTVAPTNSTLNAMIVSYTISQQGAEEESSESIKENAPLFHNSANRAVTKSDYTAICTKQPSIKEAVVWGGDDEYPKAPGHIWFSFYPSTLTRTFTNDEFKTTFTLDDYGDTINWYLEDDEIYVEPDIYGNVANPGVWNRLSEYKIPTLVYHNRHPLYIDFSYDMEIMKYNIQTSRADVHQATFDVINDYFKGLNETQPMEQFGSDYFHSNLEKRIDSDLTDITGFNNTPTYEILLNKKTLVAENDNLGNKDIIIPLAAPFERYFDGDNLMPEKLPSIDTTDFMGIGQLTTDWSGLTGNELGEQEITAPIMLNSVIVGKYTFYNNSRQDIVVTLYVKGTGADGVYTNAILESYFDEPQYLSLKYNSPNFRIIKNCIPRLKNVTFKV